VDPPQAPPSNSGAEPRAGPELQQASSLSKKSAMVLNPRALLDRMLPQLTAKS